MGIRNRPVRLMSKVYSEQLDSEAHCVDSIRESKRYKLEVEKLERLSTRTLLCIAMEEGAKVHYQFGRGQRKKFIDAIAIGRILR